MDAVVSTFLECDFLLNDWIIEIWSNYGREVTIAGAWRSWSHGFCNQKVERERDKCKLLVRCLFPFYTAQIMVLPTWKIGVPRLMNIIKIIPTGVPRGRSPNYSRSCQLEGYISSENQLRPLKMETGMEKGNKLILLSALFNHPSSVNCGCSLHQKE